MEKEQLGFVYIIGSVLRLGKAANSGCPCFLAPVLRKRLSDLAKQSTQECLLLIPSW